MKEMPLEERYDRLLEQYMLYQLTNYTLIKELDATDQYYDFLVKVNKKMLPSMLRVAFKAMKTLAPSKVFNRLVDDFVYTLQMYLPLKNVEVKQKDSEATIKVNNCPALKKMRGIVKKTGLKVDPTEMCRFEGRMFQELADDLGVNLISQAQKDGCKLTAIQK
jgi:hypothetical protein